MDLLKRLAVTIGIALALVLVIGVAARIMGPKSLHGKPAPDFTLYDLENAERSISDSRGHPVILNFWGSWCANCAREMEVLDEIQQEHPHLHVLAINVDGSRRFVDRVSPEEKYPNLTVLHCGPSGGLVRGMKEAYGVISVPRTFIVDREGVVRAELEGLHSKEKIVSRLESLGLLAPMGDESPP